MKLYLVRHGQTIWNSEKRMQGWENSDLTDRGIEEAKKLGEKLNKIDFSKVYSSPAGRALQTAEYASGKPRNEMGLIEGFKEMGFGVWEGEYFENFQGEEKIEFEKVWNDPVNYRPKGGETFQQVEERAKKSFDELLERHQGEEILVVSHGVLIRVLMSVIKGVELKDIWNQPVIGNTSLTIVEFSEDGSFNIISEGDISHLD